MQLRGLGAEVLPHRIGALGTYRQQYTLISTDMTYIHIHTDIDKQRIWHVQTTLQTLQWLPRKRCTLNVNKNVSGVDFSNSWVAALSRCMLHHLMSQIF